MVVVVVVELAVEDCEGGRRVVVPVRAVAEDLARVWRGPEGAGSGGWPVVAPETARRAEGMPEEVVGREGGAAAPDVAGRVEADGWRMEVRVRRLGGSGLAFSRWRAEDEVMRAKTPDSGRELVVELRAGRVAGCPGGPWGCPWGCPLTGSLLGEALRGRSPLVAAAAPAVEVLDVPVVVVAVVVLRLATALGLRRERARDSALPDDVGCMAVVSVSASLPSP